MYTQVKRMIEQVLPQDLSSTFTPISCEMVGDSSFKWREDINKTSTSPTDMSDVNRASRKMAYNMKQWIDQLSIEHDQGDSEESVLSSSSLYSTPCP